MWANVDIIMESYMCVGCALVLAAVCMRKCTPHQPCIHACVDQCMHPCLYNCVIVRMRVYADMYAGVHVCMGG